MQLYIIYNFLKAFYNATLFIKGSYLILKRVLKLIVIFKYTI